MLLLAGSLSGLCHHLTWSKRVAKRLSDVRMPPLGPRLYCFMTSLYLTCKVTPS